MKNSPSRTPISPQALTLLSGFWQLRMIWIMTTIAFGVVGVGYSILLKRDTYVASQALIVRDEATGAVMRLGRFESQTQMKAAQETVLEMARNPQVVEIALKAVGPQSRFFGMIKGSAEPSRSDVAAFAESCVAVRAPRGAELGTTEVIYLDVKQRSKERALQLAQALCDALESQLKKVRVERADGVIQELEAAKIVCESSLKEATEKLKQMEIEAGSSLADLRGLSEVGSGSTSRLMLDQVREEARKADFVIRSLTPNVELARASLEDENLLLAAAEALSPTFPSLVRLRDGLSDAMVKTATLEGAFTASHPNVLNARQSEMAFRQNIRAELIQIIRNVEGTIALSHQKIEVLNNQEMDLGLRLSRLADMRGKYSNQEAEVKARQHKLAQIHNELTQTIAARDAAQAASLITRLDAPVLGEKPIGPGRTTIVGGATVGGLLMGLAVVFLLVPMDSLATSPPPFRPSSSDLFPEAKQSNSTPRNSESFPSARPSSQGPLDSSQTVQTNYTVQESVEDRLSAAIQPSVLRSTAPEAPATTLPAKPPVPNTVTDESTAVPAQQSRQLESTRSPKKFATSATAAANESSTKLERKLDSIEEVRAMIAKSLKAHGQGDSTESQQ